MATRTAPMLSGLLGMFGDQVFTATDLARRGTEVLNRARTRPVTISRNSQEQFALLNREQAAGLVQAVSGLNEAVDIFWAAVTIMLGDDVPRSFTWVKAFKQSDIVKMCNELNDAVKAAVSESGDWETVQGIIHEWRESAAVIQSGALATAMRESAEESPLPHPESVVPLAEEREQCLAGERS